MFFGAVADNIANRANAWNQAQPVGGDDEEEDRGRPREELGRILAGYAFRQIVQRFDGELHDVLNAGGDFLHAGRGQKRQNDQHNVDDDGHQNRVGQPTGQR